MYHRFIGQIPDGHCIRHKCDNRMCINPDHLEAGTLKDNILDRDTRGRTAHGSKIKNHILSENDVQYILEAHRRGVKNKDLADAFNVKRPCISLIVNGHNWRRAHEAILQNV